MATFLDVGLTGGICCGKSTAQRLFATLGCHTLDSDAVYHQLIQPGRPLHARLVEWLGERVLDGRNRIDRVVLGEIVFNDDEALKKLNAIAHPMVVDEQGRLKRKIQEDGAGGIIITDAALMIEAGTYERYDKIVVVSCDPDEQLRRLMLRTRLDADSAKRRIASQMSAEEKLGYADYPIYNSESLEALKRQVEEVYAHLVLDLRAKERGRV